MWERKGSSDGKGDEEARGGDQGDDGVGMVAKRRGSKTTGAIILPFAKT